MVSRSSSSFFQGEMKVLELPLLPRGKSLTVLVDSFCLDTWLLVCVRIAI